jgi:glycosyltransferase involved in cell wall biosynthesis
MKIALATVGGDATDVRVWSGTPAHLSACLTADSLGVALPFEEKRLYDASILLARGTTKALSRRVNWEVEPRIVRRFLAGATKRAAAAGADVLVALGWLPYGAETAGMPVFYWGDATIACRVGKVQHWSKLSRRTMRQVATVEGQAMREAAGVIMPSHWALEDARTRYGLDPDRSHVIPFGANMNDPGPIDRSPTSSRVQLLTVGVEWQRKGMDRAIHVADAIAASGVPVDLHVVGVKPPDGSWSRPFVHFHGHLSKRDPAQQKALEQLYREAHFFVLLSRRDPFPMVLAEAQSYSLPVVVTAVDGIPERAGPDAILIEDSDPARPAADAVLTVWRNEAEYRRVARGSRQQFLHAGNWNRSARMLHEVCLGVAP